MHPPLFHIDDHDRLRGILRISADAHPNHRFVLHQPTGMVFFGQERALQRANQRSTSRSRSYRTCRGRAGDWVIYVTNHGYAECASDIADRIGNRRRAAASEKQRHWLRRSLGDDERAGITCRAERAAVDGYLVEVKDCELLPLA